MRDIIQDLMKANAAYVDDFYQDVEGTRQHVTWATEPVKTLPTIAGAPVVHLHGDILEFYNTVDGATNVDAHQRWLSRAEMTNPVAPVWDDVARFENGLIENAERDPTWKTTRLEWANSYEDDLYWICENYGWDSEKGVPDHAGVVYFAYEFMELAHHQMFVVFENAECATPRIFNMWDGGAPDRDIRTYLEEVLEFAKSYES